MVKNITQINSLKYAKFLGKGSPGGNGATVLSTKNITVDRMIKAMMNMDTNMASFEDDGTSMTSHNV